MPPPDDRVDLRADVRALSVALVGTDQGVAFDPEALRTARERFAALPATERRDVAIELTAVGAKIESLGGAGVDLVLAQLLLIVIELVGSAREAADLFLKAGVSSTAVKIDAGESRELPPSAETQTLWK